MTKSNLLKRAAKLVLIFVVFLALSITPSPNNSSNQIGSNYNGRNKDCNSFCKLIQRVDLKHLEYCQRFRKLKGNVRNSLSSILGSTNKVINFSCHGVIATSQHRQINKLYYRSQRQCLQIILSASLLTSGIRQTLNPSNM